MNEDAAREADVSRVSSKNQSLIGTRQAAHQSTELGKIGEVVENETNEGGNQGMDVTASDAMGADRSSRIEVFRKTPVIKTPQEINEDKQFRNTQTNETQP